jgi:rubrerythrin
MPELKKGENAMPNEATVNELFELAIAAEEAAEELYRGLQAKFAPHPDVARFWREYAAEEAAHARWLERIRGKLNPEQLSAPADSQMVSDVRKILRFSIENALKGIKNLEEACQLVSEVESSETNAIFEFLITDFATDEQAQSFIRAQLKDHITKISTGFPPRFRSAASRLAIKVTE